MADNISNIIDPQVMPDLQALIDKLVAVEGEIKTINGQTLSILVDLKGAESLTRLTELINQQQITIDKLNGTATEYVNTAQQVSAATAQLGTSTESNVRALVQQKQELAYVNEQIKTLNKDLSTGAGDIQKNTQYLEQLTRRQIELKGEISNTSKALKDFSSEAGQANDSINVFGINATQLLTRMAVRMVAMQLLFIPIIAGVTAMAEAFTKLSPAEKEAADRLKEYTDQLKELRKAQADYLGDIDKSSQLANISAQGAVKGIGSKNKNVQEDSYKKLLDLVPRVMELYTKEQVLHGDATAAIEKEIDKRTILEAAIKGNTVELGKQQDLLTKEQVKLNGAKTPLAAESLQQVVDKRKSEIDGLKAILIQQQGSLEEITAPIEKVKKPKALSKRGLEDDLKEEDATYKLVLAKNQERYEANKNNLLREDNLNRENETALKSHVERLRQIAEDWHKKSVLNNEEYNTELTKIQAQEVDGGNKATQEEQRLADERKKKHDEDLKELEQYNAKLLEASLKMQEIELAASQAKKAQAQHHSYAKSTAPFGEVFGSDNDFEEQIKGYDSAIEFKKKELADAQKKLSNAEKTGNTNNIDKYTGEEEGAKSDIGQLQIEAQKAVDDKIIDGKKEVATQTINLAQQTFQSLKTISDNQIAFEQQQIQIRSQQINLQYQNQVNAINASAGYQITKENQLATLAAKNAAQQNALQQQANELTLKKARGDKQAAEAGIIANTALAITKVWASYGATPPIAAALTAIIAATGAVQYAAAASTPLPQFYKGGVTATDYFIAGERGAELMTTPSGQTILADKPGIYTAPIGTKISTADETQKMINALIGGIGYNKETIGNAHIKSDQMTDKRMVGKLNDIQDVLVSINHKQSVVNNIIKISSNKLQRPK